MMFKNRERIWVAGAGGQVGRDFVRLLEKAEEVELIPTDIGDVDITDGDSVRLFMEMNRPEIIVNCVGMTDILACEENKDDAFRINALGARNLSVAARSFRSRIVQISTDDVFDGTTEQPYDEFDTPVPNSVYGKSKLAGENFVRSIAPKYLILRSSWVYGEGKNFCDGCAEKNRKWRNNPGRTGLRVSHQRAGSSQNDPAAAGGGSLWNVSRNLSGCVQPL